MKRKVTAADKLLFLFNPSAAERRIAKRGIQMASGYGNHGASTTKNSLIGWLTGQGSAEQDIDLHGAMLRQRARDLDVGGGLARGAVRRLQTAVVGAGLMPKPSINADVLGLSPEDSNGDSQSSTLDSGNRVIDGIEVDETGRVVAYWITNRHPLNTDDATELTYERIDAFGNDTGMPNVLHPYEPDRPEQRRGMPFIAPVIEKLKQLDRYMNSELAASLVASMLTVFFTTTEDPVGMPLEDPLSEDDRVTDAEEKVELRPGGIYTLKPGVQPVTVNPSRQNSAFQSFVDSATTYIGSTLGIPIEVLNEKFSSNYSASRAALLEFWRTVKMRRQWFIYDVCQPIYEAWLSEAVALGRLDCPGFWDDPVIRAAWCNAEWVGSSMGQIDPLKEVNAAATRIAIGISTHEREATEFNSSSFSENAKALIRENEMLRDAKGALDSAEKPIQGSKNSDEEDD